MKEIYKTRKIYIKNKKKAHIREKIAKCLEEVQRKDF